MKTQLFFWVFVRKLLGVVTRGNQTYDTVDERLPACKRQILQRMKLRARYNRTSLTMTFSYSTRTDSKCGVVMFPPRGSKFRFLELNFFNVFIWFALCLVWENIPIRSITRPKTLSVYSFKTEAKMALLCWNLSHSWLPYFRDWSDIFTCV